ncbi:hypothetical protein AQUCO_01100313v1 [Aquilegia coerulea]|uniref:Transmembrane protein n=1 Tax=Aquilegia coerulea TaxID=218851 RepID=A0A2G5E6P7_AQUCA|nr:hypothetical protein AQUCO_01100313v1 [Aquilegia coerulea]
MATSKTTLSYASVYAIITILVLISQVAAHEGHEHHHEAPAPAPNASGSPAVSSPFIMLALSAFFPIIFSLFY